MVSLSIVIPTYRRERVLLDALEHLLSLRPAPAEILIVDQTEEHEAETDRALSALDGAQKIRWLRLPRPSVTRAMNVGLRQARGEVVLFLDDDITPHPDLVGAHLAAHGAGYNIVAGQVLQPGEEPRADSGAFRFSSSRRQFVGELMGGNFSVKRAVALRLGGFDENFVRVAYRFEAEFSGRARDAGEKILFEPAASIRHLKEARGGTRSFGHHLTTIKPSHSVGSYYFYLRSKNITNRFRRIIAQPFRAVRTKHHLKHPWWIVPTVAAEVMGLAWAVFLYCRGPRLIEHRRGVPPEHG